MLFYRQGYDDTTVEEIIEESGTSRGSFYHYFQGKDNLLSTLALSQQLIVGAAVVQQGLVSPGHQLRGV